MRGSAFALVLAAVFAAPALPPGLLPLARAADMPVDLELILAVDVSQSMDIDEQKLQRDGYVAALTHPDVVSAITQGRHGKIALSYVEWAGPDIQYKVMDWRVIDVSGDGPNNMGIPIELARDPLVRAGITINGLPIMIKRASGFASIDNLDVYYEDCVIGGFGAFLVVVQSADQFAEAIRRKLVLEIAGAPPQVNPAEPRVIPAAAPGGKRIDCLIGEKLREQWMRE